MRNAAHNDAVTESTEAGRGARRPNGPIAKVAGFCLPALAGSLCDLLSLSVISVSRMPSARPPAATSSLPATHYSLLRPRHARAFP